MFELIVVIAIISVLAAFALDKYVRLLIDVERTSMQHDLGVMRSALSLQFADCYVRQDKQGAQRLIDTNPMDMLSEKPKNYLGEYRSDDTAQIETGSWYFDSDNRVLVYLVRHKRYFETKLSPKRARFKIYPVYSEKQVGNSSESYLAGLRLKAIESYRWLKN